MALIMLGGLLLALAQLDDSPGLGGLGLLAAAIGLLLAVRALLQGMRPRP